MKLILSASILMAGVAFTGFETWTNKNGKLAELEGNIVSRTESPAELTKLVKD